MTSENALLVCIQINIIRTRLETTNNMLTIRQMQQFIEKKPLKVSYIYKRNMLMKKFWKLTALKSASDLFLLAFATAFMASMLEPTYFKANFPLTMFWTSSGL